MDRRTDRHHLVGVHSLVEFLAEELGHLGLNHRHPRLATDQNHLVDVLRREFGVGQSLSNRLEGAVDEFATHDLKVASLQRQLEMLRPFFIDRDEREIDVRGKR